MNRKRLLLLIIITIIVGIIGYLQVKLIIIQNPNKEFVPITIYQAKNTQDNNMALSFLYNITKEKHPMGTEADYRVKTYIENVLNEMNVNYNTYEQKLNEDFFYDRLKRNKESPKHLDQTLM